MIFFALFVLKLAIVHDPADRRFGVWRYLNQIIALVLGLTDRISRFEDTELLTFWSNYPDFGIPNKVIDSLFVRGGTAHS
jgi:hypothetical protein